MDTATGTSPEPLKMRANRKVVTARCAICDRGFELAEEVYACPFCGGFHHVQCWDANLSCEASNAAMIDGEGEPSSIVAAPPASPDLAPDERRCPVCSQIIKQEALKCRFCGTVFDSELVAKIAPTEIPSDLAAEIEKLAKDSLTYALVGIIIFPPILEWKAISNGNKALQILRDHPHYAAVSSARGKARAGVVIGIIALSLWVIGFLSQLGSH